MGQITNPRRIEVVPETPSVRPAPEPIRVPEPAREPEKEPVPT